MVTKLLDDDDLANINLALDKAEEVEEDLLRAEQAGLDVTNQRARFEADRAKLRSVKSAFFPNR